MYYTVLSLSLIFLNKCILYCIKYLQVFSLTRSKLYFTSLRVNLSVVHGKLVHLISLDFAVILVNTAISDFPIATEPNNKYSNHSDVSEFNYTNQILHNKHIIMINNILLLS